MLNINDYQNIFHEVKNSIAVIGCSMQLIEKKHPEVKEFTYWKDTINDVASLRNLILDISSTKSCENIQISDVNPYDFLSEIRSAARTFLSEEMTLRFDIPFHLPTFYFDPLRIRQMFVNLIKNSAEALGEKGEILIRTTTQDDFIIFEICDNGCGMSEETLSQIFQPFFSSKASGTGLGLVITKGIVEAHHGTLDVSSTLGKGTKFTVKLPLHPTQSEKSDLGCEAS